jgi:hypothetical protein
MLWPEFDGGKVINKKDAPEADACRSTDCSVIDDLNKLESREALEQLEQLPLCLPTWVRVARGCRRSAGSRPGPPCRRSAPPVPNLWVPETRLTSCDLRMFMEEAAERVVAADAGEVGLAVFRERARRGAACASARCGRWWLEWVVVLGHD